MTNRIMMYDIKADTWEVVPQDYQVRRGEGGGRQWATVLGLQIVRT